MARRDLPPNTYCRKGYYTWRNPQTREEFGLGRNKATAIPQAVEANIHIAKLTNKPRLIDRLTGSAERSVGAWALKYAEAHAKQDFAENTRRSYASLNRRLVTMLGEKTALKSVTALQVSEMLEAVQAEGKARLAQALRNYARDWCREAIVQGWIDDNPVRDTKLSTTVEVKRTRLSLEVLMQVYERSRFPWLKNAIALALVTAQRREDIVAAQFSAFRDGGWWCVQESEKATHPHRLFIPLELRLDVFGMSLGDVLSQCRRTGAVSRYLVHQTRPRGNSPVGAQIWLDTLSRRFSETLAELGIDWGDRTPPTFHEIRSLSERLYAAQGGVNTQHLLGHNDASTTALYHDTRGTEWVHILDKQ
jgi:integrase